jgi:hydroxyacylglutathione hydrolase
VRNDDDRSLVTLGELQNGIHVIDGVDYLNVFLVECDEHVVLFDTGFSRKDGPRILEYIRKLGKPVKHLIVTHHHMDHVANIKRIRKETGAALAFHQAEAPKIPYEADILLVDGQQLDSCAMEIIHLPGHTAGNISIYLPGRKALILGDTIFDEGGLIPPPKHYCEDYAHAQQIIQKLLKYDFTVIFPSHGRPMIENAYPEVKALVRRIAEAGK